MAFDSSKFVDPRKQTREFDSSQFVDPRTQPAQPSEAEQAAAAIKAAREADTGGRFDEVQDFAAGVNKALGGIGRLPVQAAAAITDSPAIKRSLVMQEMRERKAYDEATKRSPIAAALGKGAPEFALAATVPGGAVGGIFRRLITGALAGGAIGAGQTAGQYASGDETSLRDLAENVATGTAFGAAGGALGRVLRGGTDLITRRQGRQVPRLGRAAINKLDPDIPLTRSELSPKSTIARKQQADTFLTRERAQKIENLVNKRDTQSARKFNRVLAEIVPEGREAVANQVDDIFRRADATVVPQSVRQQLAKNPIINQAIAQVEKDPTLGAGDLAPGSFGKLRLVKEALDDSINRFQIAGERNRARNVIKAKDMIVRKLDELNPEYAVGRAMHQRLRIQENFNKGLDELREVGGITPKAIFQKFFSTKAKQDDFLKELGSAKGDVEGAKKLIRTFKLISQGNTDKLFNKASGVEGAAVRGQNIIAAVPVINRLLNQTDGRVLMKSLTDPRFAREVEAIGRATKISDAVERTAKLFSRAATIMENNEE